MHHPQAAILITGNEILSGQIHESNSFYMIKELTKLGIEVTTTAILPDDVKMIADYVRRERRKVDYFFVSGGIGGTHDDVTRPAIARAVGGRLRFHPELVQIFKAFYRERLNRARMRMAELPESAELIIPKKFSAAPGFRVKNIYVFAGIPELMEEQFRAVKPTLQNRPSFHTTIQTQLREGDFADGLTKIQRDFPRVKIGSYPFFWKKRLGGRIVLRGSKKKEISEAARKVRNLLKST